MCRHIGEYISLELFYSEQERMKQTVGEVRTRKFTTSGLIGAALHKQHHGGRVDQTLQPAVQVLLGTTQTQNQHPFLKKNIFNPRNHMEVSQTFKSQNIHVQVSAQ